MEINRIIAQELSLKPEQVDNAVSMIDEGMTIPFIARATVAFKTAIHEIIILSCYHITTDMIPGITQSTRYLTIRNFIPPYSTNRMILIGYDSTNLP